MEGGKEEKKYGGREAVENGVEGGGGKRGSCVERWRWQTDNVNVFWASISGI